MYPACSRAARCTRQSTILFYLFYLNQYLTRSIQFRTASLNEADTKHKDIKTLRRLNKKIKLSRQHVQVLLSKMEFILILAPLFMCEHRLF